ncbi:DUF4136 domain-containing protein [Pedobacter sp. PLR]|uniref:DUF4136 domain-containing protein n=1 Tax=Pedobacter sp. PLR TaxID=2994465 RepID=UPI0022452E02|nr:DUF4136 domain-containing protein [Pedobacter sp. PLR]MCX2450087.1 DUF4136 domain-containing protein [Pedobacter sp. PLR]
MKKQLFVVLALLATLTACSPYTYYAVSNKPLNATYKTYAWIPEGQSKTSNIYNNDIATDLIVETASQQLNTRGLTLDNAKPDILVRYTAVVNKETRIYNEPVYYYSPWRMGPRVSYYRGRSAYYYSFYDPFPIYVGSTERRMIVKESSIMIDLIDRRSSKVIWRGWAEGVVNNPEKAINELPQVVTNIFKKLI